MKTKREIRTEILEKRKSLSSDEVVIRSHQIVQQLFSINEVQTAKKIHCYVSALSNEVRTEEILKYILAEKRQLYVPKIQKQNKNLSSIQINSLSELDKGTMGIPEPCNENAVQQIAFDVIIVPLLAVDNNGNRIGFGGGYYDRFLSSVEGIKIGICYDFQLLPEIPSEPHDVRLDIIAAESHVIRCR
ncbi:MAG: 5-formyltetrahydrofolate cyclo-ligase [Bacteroidetes bacterium]|nr:5-formyltetrahydrofolate cyclo-ligase [Bacteroidota bacterium]